MNTEKKTLVDEAYEQIRRKICDFELLPGQPVSDFILSKALGMSRTPIREALRRVESDGLIRSGGAGQSYFVSEITRESLQELFDARTGLELTALSVINRDGISEENLEYLKKINELMEDANRGGHIKRQFYYDQKFHDQLVISTGNSCLIRFSDSLQLQLSRVRVLSYLERSFQEKAYREHEELIRFLEERKVRESIELLRAHIVSTRENYIQLLENRVDGDALGVLSLAMRSDNA